MSKLNAGDLALIIGSRSGESPNIGKCVTLHKRVIESEKFISPNGDIWKEPGCSAWAVHGDGVLASRGGGGYVESGGYTLVEERFLMPMRGDFQPEKQKQQEKCDA